MNFTIHLSNVQWKFKMQIIKPLSSIAGLPKLYNSYSEVRTHMYFFLAKNVEMLHKMNPTVFISLLETCRIYQHSLLLADWWVRKDWNKREAAVPYFFPFLQFYHFGRKWLANGGKGHERGRLNKVSGSPVFLRTPLSSSRRRKFWLKRKAWLLATVSIPTGSVKMEHPYLRVLVLSIKEDMWIVGP